MNKRIHTELKFEKEISLKENVGYLGNWTLSRLSGGPWTIHKPSVPRTSIKWKRKKAKIINRLNFDLKVVVKFHF